MTDDQGREEQLAYSETMAKMLDEQARRQKAAKLIAVVRHALGVQRLDGLCALDVGCSAGFIADELALAGATTTGVDIDEPGLAKARARFGERVDFRVARGDALPTSGNASSLLAKAFFWVFVVVILLMLFRCDDSRDCSQVRATYGEASAEYQNCVRSSSSGGRTGGGSFGGWSSGGSHK